MSELPKDWVRCTVGDIAALLSGPAFRSAEFVSDGDGIRLLRGDNIEPNSLRWANLRSWPRELLPGHEHLLIREDDVILAMDRPLVSSGLKIALAARSDVPALLVQRVARIRSNRAESQRFLYYSLQQDRFRAYLLQGQTGTQLPHISLRQIEDFEIALPPLAEQERIVAAIEEAFSKLDFGETGLRTVRRLLTRMREAILAAAVTGRLVAQDSADTPATKLLADLGTIGATATGLPDGWARVRLGDIARVGSGTTPTRGNPAYWKDGTVPWITSGLISSGTIREARELVTHRAVRDTSLRLWPSGTLLVAMYGEGKTRGRCAELAIEATCNQACAAIVLHERLRGYKDFVRIFFDANYTAHRRLASGGVQPNLNAGLIKDMVLALPPVDEQLRIVTEVDRQFSFIESCERAVEAGLARSAALRRSVLKAAFEGRLVPQDSSDEPASMSLERIRAERATSDGSSGGRRRKKVGAS